MILRSFLTGPLAVNCYLLGCEETGAAVVVDPGGGAEEIAAAVRQEGLRLAWIANTHAHFDHLFGIAPLQRLTGAPFALHGGDLPLLENLPSHAAMFGMTPPETPRVERVLSDGDTLVFGREALEVLHTPGHSPGSVTFLSEGALSEGALSDGAAFTGDTLFASGVGRTDLPLGNYPMLMDSIRKKLLTLPDETKIYPGHGPPSTIGAERISNPFLVGME